MKAYRIYYDKINKQWKFDNFLSEVGQTTDFERWNTTISIAEKVCMDYNRDFVADIKDMYSSDHYTICTCKDCKEDYILTCDEYYWFFGRGLNIPKRCPKCRNRRRNK